MIIVIENNSGICMKDNFASWILQDKVPSYTNLRPQIEASKVYTIYFKVALGSNIKLYHSKDLAVSTHR